MCISLMEKYVLQSMRFSWKSMFALSSICNFNSFYPYFANEIHLLKNVLHLLPSSQGRSTFNISGH